MVIWEPIKVLVLNEAGCGCWVHEGMVNLCDFKCFIILRFVMDIRYVYQCNDHMSLSISSFSERGSDYDLSFITYREFVLTIKKMEL